MVTRFSQSRSASETAAVFPDPKRSCGNAYSRQRGTLTTELIVAIAILSIAMIPISFDFLQEGKLCRIYYYEAVAMEIVDGEMEVLAAGEWREFNEGQHDYPVHAAAAENLPAGRFVLTRTDKLVRLEWRPNKPGQGRPISREWRIR